MTREEAIKLLLESKDNDIERTMREWEEWDKRYFKAIDMAIEALKEAEAKDTRIKELEYRLMGLNERIRELMQRYAGSLS